MDRHYYSKARHNLQSAQKHKVPVTPPSQKDTPKRVVPNPHTQIRSQYKHTHRRQQHYVSQVGCGSFFSSCFGSSPKKSTPNISPRQEVKYPTQEGEPHKHIEINLKVNTLEKYQRSKYKKEQNDMATLLKATSDTTKDKEQTHMIKSGITSNNKEEIQYYWSKVQTHKVTHFHGYPQSFKSDIPGLRNVGNTCYMNSVIQCLHKSSLFKSAITQCFYCPEQHSLTPQLLGQTTRLFIQLDQKTRYPCDPTCIKKVVSEKNYLFSSHNQNDASEFLNTFLWILASETNRPNPKKEVKIDHEKMQVDEIYRLTIQKDECRNKSLIDRLFTGRYKTTYNCCECRQTYTMFQRFNVHYVPIPTVTVTESKDYYYGYRYKNQTKPCSVEDCLNVFQEIEILDGANAMTCNSSKCQGKDTKTSKVMQIYESNILLSICFKRFDNGYKNDREVNFTEQLVLIKANKKYRLYGIILHFGSLYSGHYVAICYHQIYQQWYQYSDSFVRPTSLEAISRKNIYALFYEKIKDPSQTSDIISARQESLESYKQEKVTPIPQK